MEPALDHPFARRNLLFGLGGISLGVALSACAPNRPGNGTTTAS